ncbi:MAG: DUF418 domain-containing protein [Phycisphaeraceae bacterium]|nr:DUF418 domain-containing protein [Phycisphaeraceae bacterium]
MTSSGSPEDTAGSTGATYPVGPIRVSDRLGAIDTCRGLALLGIFMVNITIFSGPIGDMLKALPPAPTEGITEHIAHYFTAIFFSGKFYPLFSLLFGAGLILQMSSVERRGGRFVPLYLRRLVVLAVIGLSHAIVLWYGDILFIYAFAGLAMLLLRKLRPSTLFILAGVLFGLITVVTLGAAAIGAMVGAAPASTSVSEQAPDVPVGTREQALTADGHDASVVNPAAPADSDGDVAATDGKSEAGEPYPGGPADTAAKEEGDSSRKDVPDEDARPYEVFLKSMESRSDRVQGPWDDRWKEAERDVYRHGGFVPALVVRSITWASMIIFCLFGFGWHVLMMFMIGAALIKVDFFSPSRERWHVRLAWLGLLVGVPLSVVSAAATVLFDPGFARAFLQGWGVMAGGPLMALMYVSLLTLAVNRGYFPAATGAVANVGRMALTNYLMQSVIATFIFYWYGLGLFDQVSRVACVSMVLGIYLVQVLFSNVWMSFFLYGPMEWLWRLLTYLRVPSLFRTASSDRAVGP